MDKALAQEVRRRADSRCEYCRLHQRFRRFPHVIDHFIARQHAGQTVSDNLALCCGHCNLHKGPNLSGIDPDSGALTRLFHPRRDVWEEHFQWRGPTLVGLTDVGRTTVVVLAMNAPELLADRVARMEEGLFPD
jgi:hypothetical protein